MARICETCGGEEFDPFTWTCVTCKYNEAKFGARPGDSPDNPNEAGQGEGEGNPDGEGEGEPPPGEGQEPPPEDQLIVLKLGEIVELEDGTVCLVVERPTKLMGAAATWFLTFVVLTGKIAWRLKSVTAEDGERRHTTTVEPGDFLFDGAKQEIVAQQPKSLSILDNCEYTVVDLDSGEVKGLTKEDAQKVTKLDAEE